MRKCRLLIERLRGNYMGGDTRGVKVLLSQEHVDVTLFA